MARGRNFTRFGQRKRHILGSEKQLLETWRAPCAAVAAEGLARPHKLIFDRWSD
jgi:hypothetical protein